MPGYAVVDVETTGLRPSWHDRIVEIAVVHVTPHGEVESSWSTLVNPERDLGPQEIHGVSAADVLHAPTFEDIAGTLASLLAGRVFVAHNAQFDLGFVSWSFEALGFDVPLVPSASVCTMYWAHRWLPTAPRTLAGCCAAASLEMTAAHEALSDATAAAGLLRHYLHASGMTMADDARHRHSIFRRPSAAWRAPWADAVELAESARWPDIPFRDVVPVRRGVAAERHIPFLARLVEALPETASTPEQEQYLALVDRALLDRHLSSREHDALAAAASDLRIDRGLALELHRSYIGALATVAVADGVVTTDEHHDLHAAAALLGLEATDVDVALQAATDRSAPGETTSASTAGFALRAGDMVVLTGAMETPREVWNKRAADAGLVVHTGVTKKVALVVAADPDSLSGKARKAATYGIPIVTEHAFARMVGELSLRTVAQ